MENKIQLDTIEEAIEAIKNGEIIIVVDDEDRENEGDFICAADQITPEKVNFMVKEGRGLMCCSLTEERCKELGLSMMVSENTAEYETPFTISVDLVGYGCTTGISAHDRSKTIQAIANPNTKPEELGKPGHIFPLRARKGGVLKRTGHTEATVDFARLAGLTPVGVLIEIMSDDGSMARLPELRQLADKHGLKLVSIADLIQYRLKNDSLIEELPSFELDSSSNIKVRVFKETISEQIHYALCKGNWSEEEDVLVRVHVSGIKGNILDSSTCAAKHKGELYNALSLIEQEEKGMVLYMNQEKDSSLSGKISSQKEQNEKLQRDYGIGAQIIRELGIRKIRLMTNSPIKRVGLVGYDLEVVETVSLGS